MIIKNNNSVHPMLNNSNNLSNNLNKSNIKINQLKSKNIINLDKINNLIQNINFYKKNNKSQRYIK